jgi:hypothetical protein
MACKGVKPTNMNGCLALGVVYMYMGYHPCLKKHVPCLEIHDTTLGSVILHWDLCTHIWSYPLTSRSVPFDFGFMYFIGIHITALGFVIVHLAI